MRVMKNLFRVHREKLNAQRTLQLANLDPELPQKPTPIQREELLTKRRRQLVVFLSQVANCVSTNHYTTVLRHATSLQWIFDKIRQDYDINHKGIHFLNLSRLKYDPDTMTPAGFYQLYRAHIINHTARARQTIQWNNNQVLVHDEVIGAAFEDHILYSIIALIDSRLIDHISKHYQLKLTDGQRLMDIRADIFINI